MIQFIFSESIATDSWTFINGYKYNIRGAFEDTNRYTYEDCAEICEFYGDYVKVIEPRDNQTFQAVMKAINQQVTISQTQTSSHAFWINAVRQSNEL